jgi:hypothetical protein
MGADRAAYIRKPFPYNNEAALVQRHRPTDFSSGIFIGERKCRMGRNQANNNGKRKQPGNRGDSETAQAGTSKEK